MQMHADAMRHAGQADALFARLSDPGADPVLRRATPAEMRQRVGGPPPDASTEFAEVLRRGMQDVLPFANRPDHLGYFAFIDSSTTFPAAVAECIAAAANPCCGASTASLTREPALPRPVDCAAAERLNRRQ